MRVDCIDRVTKDEQCDSCAAFQADSANMAWNEGLR